MRAEFSANRVDAPSAQNLDTPLTPPGWIRVVAAPLLDVLRPRSAACCLARASRPAFAFLFVASVFAFAALTVVLAMCVEMVQSTYIPPTSIPASMPMSTTGQAAFPVGHTERTTRPFAQVWRDWHTD